MPVEKGTRTIARTAHDIRTGEQTHWFGSFAEFEQQKADIFEAPTNFNKPIPHILIVSQGEHDLEELKKFIHDYPESIETALTLWREAREEAFEREFNEQDSTLNKECQEFIAGIKLAHEGHPLPANATPFLSMGFHCYRAPEPEPDPTPTPTPPPESSEPEVIPTPAPPVSASPEPADASPSLATLQEKVFQAHAGRTNIRLNDFAKELDTTPEALRAIIESDPRFKPIPAPGWVRVKTESA